jgi:hypothetical protein
MSGDVRLLLDLTSPTGGTLGEWLLARHPGEPGEAPA